MGACKPHWGGTCRSVGSGGRCLAAGAALLPRARSRPSAGEQPAWLGPGCLCWRKGNNVLAWQTWLVAHACLWAPARSVLTLPGCGTRGCDPARASGHRFSRDRHFRVGTGVDPGDGSPFPECLPMPAGWTATPSLYPSLPAAAGRSLTPLQGEAFGWQLGTPVCDLVAGLAVGGGSLGCFPPGAKGRPCSSMAGLAPAVLLAVCFNSWRRSVGGWVVIPTAE